MQTLYAAFVLLETRAGHFQTSYSSLLNVHEANRTDTIIEKTKWLWSQVSNICIYYSNFNVLQL